MKNKIFNVLLAVVIACGLWLYVITVERTETEQTFYNVPVILDGETVLQDRGLRVVSDKDLTVTLKLNGNRSDLNKLRSSDITVLVDLTRIYEAGTKELTYTVTFPGDIQNGSIEVVDRSPGSITLDVVEWATKEIPVKAELYGAPSGDYMVDAKNMVLEYDTVTIAGPKGVVDQIAMATVAVDMHGRTESVEERVNITLCDLKGSPVNDVSSVTPDPYRILVKVPVLMVKDIRLEIPVIDGGGLTHEDVTVTMEYDTITVSGSPAVVSKMDDVITLGTIDLSKESESFTDRSYPIDLPDGVQNVSGVDEVKVSLQLPAVKLKAFVLKISNGGVNEDQVDFQTPEGYAAKVQTKNLTVYVRGRETILNKVMASDIRVVVDLTGATQTGYYPATVVVENISDVGVVPDPGKPNSTYEVWMEIKAVES
ncbi:MAG: hypothetical protein IJW45_07555 [Oscillospiraceae bacterium]|nr:hypothetical protein [Oscillospiraceae bacterium]